MITSINGLSGFSQSSVAQARQQMFGRIDTNSDGKHDADELARMVANNPQGGPGVDDILTLFDTDGDGAVSESEFNAVDAQSSSMPAGPPPSKGGMEGISTADFIKNMFGQIDVNSDGTIDMDELAQMAAMGPEGGPDADELLDELDTDGNGTISESEFNAGSWANQQVQGPPPPPPQDKTENESISTLIDALQSLNNALTAYLQSSAGVNFQNDYTLNSANTGSSLYV